MFVGGKTLKTSYTRSRAEPHSSLAPISACMSAMHDVQHTHTHVNSPSLSCHRYLGMDPVQDKDLMFIAEEGCTASVPEGWEEHVDGEGHDFYHNPSTGQSIYEHPMDVHFRNVRE